MTSFAQAKFEPPTRITFAKGPPFDEREYSTQFGLVRDVKYGDVPRGWVEYSHLRTREFGVSVEYSFMPNDKVALSGAIYRASFSDDSASLILIPDAKLPKFARVPHVDSFTIPLLRGSSTWANLQGGVQIVVREIEGNIAKPMATISVATGKLPLLYATVVEGDIVLLGDKAHIVRAVVPQVHKEKIAGWVEFAAKYTPEAELIRDKKAYIKPMPKAQKK